MVSPYLLVHARRPGPQRPGSCDGVDVYCQLVPSLVNWNVASTDLPEVVTCRKCVSHYVTETGVRPLGRS